MNEALTELTEEEIELFRGQLSAVLERAQRIQTLELDDVPPTAHPVELSSVWREDVVVPPSATEEILANAPHSEDGMFRVPSILEEAD